MVGLDPSRMLSGRVQNSRKIVILDSSFHLGVENNKAERLGYSKKPNRMSFPWKLVLSQPAREVQSMRHLHKNKLTVYIPFEKINIMINRKEALVLAKKIQDNLKNIYGSNLKLVYLFGSCARNEANEDSDIDIAVVLDGLASRYQERERCSKMRAKISLENNCVINLFFLEKNELLAKEYALFRNIFEEGILV